MFPNLETARAIARERYPGLERNPEERKTTFYSTISTTSLENISLLLLLKLSNWDTSKFNTCELQFTGESSIYIKLFVMNCYVPEWESMAKSLRIYSLHLPASPQTEEYGSSIITTIQKWAAGHAMPTFVGPVIEESIQNLMAKIGTYTRRWVMDYYYVDAKSILYPQKSRDDSPSRSLNVQDGYD